MKGVQVRDHAPVSQEILSLGNSVAATEFPRKFCRSATEYPSKFCRTKEILSLQSSLLSYRIPQEILSLSYNIS